MAWAALVIASLCFPGAVLLWRLGGLWMQAEYLEYKREKNREQAEAVAKQAHEIQAQLVTRIASLETTLGASIDGVSTRVLRLENGRVLQERQRTA